MCIGCTIEHHWLPAITEALGVPKKGLSGPNSREEAKRIKSFAEANGISIMDAAKHEFFHKHSGEPEYPGNQKLGKDVEKYWDILVEQLQTDR